MAVDASDGDITRLRHRRPDRHRPLLDVSAHQRGRGQPGRQPRRRALRLRATTAPAPRVVFQNKTPTCQYRAVGHPIASAVDGGPRRPRRRRRSASTRSSSAAATSCRDDALPVAPRPPASSSRSCRTTPRSTSCVAHDGLRRRCAPSRSGLRAQGHPPRHRLCQLHRGHQPGRRLLRRRRRAHLVAGRRDRAARARRRASCCRPASPSRARAPRPSSRQIAADARRRADRAACASSPATPTPRPTAAAPGRRAAPASAARRRCQAGKALRENVARGRRRACCRPTPDALDIVDGADRRRATPASSACRSPSSRRIAYFRPRHAAARPAAAS